MKVVILAGGFGIRLSEYTKTIPKPMINTGGKPKFFSMMALCVLNFIKYNDIYKKKTVKK